MDYKYYGLELTPAIFEALLVQLFDGKQFSRQDAIDKIKAFHLENGGVLNKASYIAVFKKAAQRLKDKGFENIGYGIWRLCYKTDAIEEIIPKPKKEQSSFQADKEIGSGSSSIYVYYYDRYKELAILKGNSEWECKIGRTDVEPIGRVLNQAGTCYPELPHIALIIYCDNSSLLETTIHSILKMKQKWIPSAPGKEWFNTSPEEIEQLYYSIFEG
ncbi:MAG: GIY-YIG nuclease family protein [Oscillospiraceae bacterium]|nr:GIY-YIG nuclease family protein [Oscillospiraceae bacterium]